MGNLPKLAFTSGNMVSKCGIYQRVSSIGTPKAASNWLGSVPLQAMCHVGDMKLGNKYHTCLLATGICS